MSWTIKSLLDWTSRYYLKHGIENPHLEAEILLAYVLKCPRINLYLKFDQVLEENILAEFKKLLIRRSKREALAYLTGSQPFMGLEFIVTPDVLIPRPETEKLVEVALDQVKLKFKNEVLIIDIGTGSGVIAVSLARFLENVLVYGTDKSEKALEIAGQNARKFGVAERCKFVKGDLFAGLSLKADLIVTNPPYISTAEIAQLQPEIKNFEPRAALDGGADGLDYYRKIAGAAPEFLKGDGKLIFEIGAGQSGKICQILEKNHFKIEKIEQDYSGINRVIIAELNPA